MTGSREVEGRGALWIGLALVAVVFAAYAPVAWHGFVGWDDGPYIEQNPNVRRGLTGDGVRWAFTTFHMGNWHPLTWLSHMLDCELFGLDAGAHHLVSVGLHAAAALVLFLALRRMTLRTWPAAIVVALFALHPLRVESVAWASERKDVLAGLFWMLTLLAYSAYSRRGGLGRYGLVAAAFALGLTAKAMLVTLPFALLLLDVWPLGRWRERGSAGRLVAEKLPLLALAAAAGWVAMLAQRSVGAVGSTEALSWGARLANAVMSYGVYLVQTFRPAGLAYFYPHPALVGFDGPGPATVLLTGGALAGLTLLAVGSRRRRPWLGVGWLWYLGTLLPVIGLVQLGMQARADRYTYIPSVGILVALVWSGAEIALRAPLWRRALAAAAALVVALCFAGTLLQVRHWRDSRALAERALAVTERNFRAHELLGVALERAEEDARAAQELRKAIEIQPACSACRLTLATVLSKLGQLDEARSLFERALSTGSEAVRPQAHNGLGALLQRRGDLPGAQRHLQRAIEMEPEFAEAHNNLGVVYELQGRMEQARSEFARAAGIAPDYALAHKNLGGILLRLGRLDQAAESLQRAIGLDGGLSEAHFKLAVVEASRGRLEAAAAGFERVLALEPSFADAHYNLGVVLVALDRGDRAVGHLERTLELAPQHAGALRALASLRAGQ